MGIGHITMAIVDAGRAGVAAGKPHVSSSRRLAGLVICARRRSGLRNDRPSGGISSPAREQQASGPIDRRMRRGTRCGLDRGWDGAVCPQPQDVQVQDRQLAIGLRSSSWSPRPDSNRGPFPCSNAHVRESSNIRELKTDRDLAQAPPWRRSLSEKQRKKPQALTGSSPPSPGRPGWRWSTNRRCR